MKATSKPPKPSRNFSQNKFGSHSNDPSPQRSQNLSPHRHKRFTADFMFVKPDHYKKSQRYLFRHFLKAVLQRWRAGGEGLSPLLQPGSSMTRAHSHALHILHYVSLTYHRPEQSRPWSLSVLQLS